MTVSAGLLLLCACALLPVVHGHIWAWMLSIPYGTPEDSVPRGDPPPASDRASTVTCDRGCSRGQYCDRHFGLCVPLRQEGQFCRKDSQCSRGLHCMFGRCHWIVPEGQEGARCRLDQDCGSSMCCARHHGEMVCKKQLTLGESCYVPDGGLAFSINQVCPCEEGLACRNRQSGREAEFEYWHEAGAWQCLRP
ncbi:uncharacterized protein LOC144753913 [Lissotriton helveticus]